MRFLQPRTIAATLALLIPLAAAAGPKTSAATVVLPSQDEVAAVCAGGELVTARVLSDGALLVEGLPPGVPAPTFRPSSGREISWPSAAAARGDRVVLAWVEGGSESARILLAEVSWDGHATSPITISASSARWSRFPSVAVAPDGEVWVAWVDGARESDGIAICHGHDGRFSAPEIASLPDASEDLVPQMSFDAKGVPLVVWAGLDGHDDEILWSRRSGSAWSAEARIHPDNAFPDVTPWAARDNRGVVHVAWSGFDGSSYQVSWSSFDGAAWSAPVRLSDGTGAATLPRVLPDGDGVVLLWNQYDGRGAVPGVATARTGDRPVRVPASTKIPLFCRPLAVRRDGGLVLVLPDGSGLRQVPVSAGR